MKLKTIMMTLVLTLALTASAQGQADFRVMSFNIERGDLGVEKKRGWDVRKDACLKMLETQRPDLLGLQECNSIQRDDIQALFPGYGRIGVAVNGDAGEHPKVSSNPIYWDKNIFELEKDGTFWFANDPASVGMWTWGAKKPRNATWGIFLHKPTGKRLLYVNMHLQNGVDAVDNRTMSFKLLYDKIREINSEDLPVICTGDLNSFGIESYYAPFNQFMYEAAEYCIKADKEGTHSGYKPGKTGRRIDHIYYRGLKGLEFVVDRNGYEGVPCISDHYPVYADLSFDDPQKTVGPFWYDLRAEEKDVRINMGTYSIGHLSSADCQNIIDLVNGSKLDVLGLQAMDDEMVKTLSKAVKKAGKGRYTFYYFHADPLNRKNSKAVGLIYDKQRLSVGEMNGFWLANDFKNQNVTWDKETYWAGFSAKLTDKASGKEFFVMTTQAPADKDSQKKCGAVIRNAEKAYNPEGLPCFLLADLNSSYRSHLHLSIFNYWCDTYCLQEAERDVDVHTMISPEENKWKARMDRIGMAHFIENNVVSVSNKVHRSEAALGVHFPVTATVVFK